MKIQPISKYIFTNNSLNRTAHSILTRLYGTVEIGREGVSFIRNGDGTGT